jgi:hypothetical protein
MQMNPGIILAGQTPDIMGQMQRGIATRVQQNEAQHTNALRALMQEQGPGIMAGEQNALAALSRFDPGAALGVQQTRQGMAHADERLGMDRQRLQLAFTEARERAAAAARNMSEADRQRDIERITGVLRGAAQLHAAGDMEGYNGWLQQNGVDPSQYSFEQFPLHAAQFGGILEGMATPVSVAPGASLVDPRTGRIIVTTPNRDATPPSAVQEYEFYSQQETAAGRPPASFAEWDAARRRAGATNVQVGGDGQRLGTVPAGYTAVPDQTNPSGFRLVPIPGGPADTSTTDARAGDVRSAADRIVVTATDNALAALDAGGGGIIGAATRFIPSTQSAEIYRQLETLQAQARIGNLQAMREASPTGGALGGVSDAEGRMLAAASGALDPRSPTFERDLLAYTRSLLSVIHGDAAGEEIFRQRYGSRAQRSGGRAGAAPPPSGGPTATPQGTPPSPQAILQMGRAELAQIDVEALDAAGMDAFEARLMQLRGQ